jgi:hypothetical protein
MKTRSKLLSATVAAAMMLLPLASFAQSTSESNSGAQAGSVSGASNNNSTTNGAQTTTVAPVNNGNGNSRSNSDSSATSGSISGSSATGGVSDAKSTATGGAGGSSSASGGSSQATNGSTTAANAQNITFNSTSPSKTTVRSAPTVYAPALTTTLTETCMGSSSAAGSGVGFGFSLGSTWHDKDCVRRLNAREMAQTLGDRDAARALLCEDDNVRKAYESIGQDCHMKVAYTPPAPPPAPYAQPVPDDSHPMAPIPNPPAKAPYGERGAVDTPQNDKLASASH